MSSKPAKNRSIDSDSLIDMLPAAISRRRIFFNVDQGPNDYGSNAISTCKYTFITFIPRFLYEQFKKYSNMFFLVISLLQQIPDVSPTGRYTTAFPLALILFCSAIKEGYEDIKRGMEDNKVNKKRVLVMRFDRWIFIRWRDVRVGDVIKLVNGDFFPADMLILNTSEPNGICYIETSNLDGETNLKVRKSPPLVPKLAESAFSVRNLNGYVDVEPPNRHLHEFVGLMSIFPDGPKIPLGPDHILLRGSQLRNTNWAYGIVLYTGHQTKLMMNSLSVPSKMSNLEKTVNKQIALMFMALVLIAFSCTFAAFLHKFNDGTRWYASMSLRLNPKRPELSFWECLMNFLTFIILYNNLVPISLTVTIEIVKFIQAIYINWDIEMYDHETNTRALARTSNLNEELGQVGFIFSDKTGTLTMNIMELRTIACKEHDGSEYVINLSDSATMKKFIDLAIKAKTNAESTLFQFLYCILACHTAVPTLSPASFEDVVDGAYRPNSIQYQASSPDEHAILNAFREFNLAVIERSYDGLTLDLQSEIVQFRLLNVLEFTSARKMMSVIVENVESGEIVLYCKGADEVVFRKSRDEDSYFLQSSLTQFAEKGLRTLCFAFRPIDHSEYAVWKDRLEEANTAVVNREERLFEVMEEIERDLRIVGVTGIEDKLQQGVPESIGTLREAGIQLWVLTGDKTETAINIGYACGILDREARLFIFEDSDNAAFEISLNSLKKLVDDSALVCLVLSGRALEIAFSDPSKSSRFVQLAVKCRSVLCCRASPRQKASVVNAVRKVTRKITLAIGDGANDVAMIQAAHVGIGVHGREGMQAASASDYSIGQFRFLIRLLLVHGVWNYRRLCKVILYCFYKNICLYIIQLWFAFYNSFSGQVLFEKWSISVYNVIFTAAQPIAIGIFDRSMDAPTVLKNPLVYKSTQNKEDFNFKVFWTYILNAVYHSVVLFFSIRYALAKDCIWSNGQVLGSHLFVGSVVYTFVVIVVSLKAGLMCESWTTMVHLSIWGSILAWIVFLYIHSSIGHFDPKRAYDMLGIAQQIFKSPVFYLLLMIVPSMTLYVDFVYAALQRTLFPTRIQNIQLRERKSRSWIDSIPLKQRPADIANRMHLKFSRIRTVFNRKSNLAQREKNGQDTKSYKGFAFSQEEDGVVLQSQVVRCYCTSACRPPNESQTAFVSTLEPTTTTTLTPINSVESSSSENDSRTRLLKK